MAGDRLISLAEARDILHRAYASDDEINLNSIIRRVTADPIKPLTKKGRMRPQTFLVSGCGMLVLLVAVFVYFSFGGR